MSRCCLIIRVPTAAIRLLLSMMLLMLYLLLLLILPVCGVLLGVLLLCDLGWLLAPVLPNRVGLCFTPEFLSVDLRATDVAV